VLAAILVAIAGGALRNDSFRPLARNGVIAFTVQGNNHEPAGAHMMNSDGTGDHPIDAGRCPTYPTDGSVLASLSYEPAAYLVVQDAAGNPVHKVLLVEDPPTSVSYALSPDGTQVAWFKPSPSGSTELWGAAVAGGPGSRLVPGSNVPDEFYEAPLWSPDGSQIAFGSYIADATTGERHRSAIYVVAADGSDPRRLTTRPGMLEDTMSWSPDGRFLAYLGLPDGPPVPTSVTDGAPSTSPPRDVFLIGADGTGDRNLTDTPTFEDGPSWSPDGAALAFETSADGEAHRLTTIHMNGPTPVGGPVLGPESTGFVWSPDGTTLVWLEVESIDAETYRTTLNSIDPDFRQTPTALQTVDGLIVCTPSWQRLEP
jgi:Tol biopolymer transport system component